MRKLSLASFIVLALVACALFFLFAQVVHADSPNPHGGHPPVISNGQGQVDKGKDPVPHVNYGLHKGQDKDPEKTPKPEEKSTPAAKPTPAAPVSITQPTPIKPVPTKEPDGKGDKDWALYPVCQTGLTTDISLSEPDGAHDLCFFGWYATWR